MDSEKMILPFGLKNYQNHTAPAFKKKLNQLFTRKKQTIVLKWNFHLPDEFTLANL